MAPACCQQLDEELQMERELQEGEGGNRVESLRFLAAARVCPSQFLTFVSHP